MSNTTQSQPFSIDEAFNCFEITFSKSSKSEQINEAQKRLMEMDKNILENLKLFLGGISLKDRYSENLKLSVLIYMKNSIDGKIKRKELTEEHIWIIIKYFIDFLISSNDLTDKIINNTNSLLQNLFNWKNIVKDSSATTELFNMIRNYLKTHIDQNQNDDSNFNIGVFKRLISLMQMLFATKSINDNNINNIFELTLNIVDLIFLKNQNIISYIIKNVSSGNIILQNFEIHRQILDLLFLVIMKIKEYESSYQKLEIIINKYANTCLQLIIDQTIPNNNMIIYITENEELDKVLNSIKAKSFQIISAIIQYGSSEIKNTTIRDICYSLIDLIIKNLDYLVANKIVKNLENYDKNLELLFYHIFLFLSRCINREPILTSFLPFVKKFIVSTLLPFMIATEKEKVNMKTEGEDYQLYIQDIIGDHKSKLARTSIDFLIVRICDKYDGLASFLTNFFIQMLDFGINSTQLSFDSNTQINEAYDLLNNPNFEFLKFLNLFNPESLIDVSIILLCSLKNYILKNQHLILKLKFIFDKYMSQLHTVVSDLIKFDICLVYDVFLSSFIDEKNISNTDLDHLTNRLDFLFSNLMNYEKNPGTSAQAAKAISTIFNDVNIDNIDSKYISNVFTQLINHIESIDIGIFFDVLIDILENCKIEENLIQAISFSTKRILKEIKSSKFESDNKGERIIFSKCFNIIKTILKENELVPKVHFENDVIIPIVGNTLSIEEVESSLQALMSYLKNPSKIQFEDDLLEILKLILSSSDTLTPLTKEYFVHLHKVIEKIGGMDILLFKVVNLYISKDDGFIFNNQSNLESLVGLLLNALESDEEIDFSPVCSTILMQVLPNNKLNVTLPDELVNKIIDTIIQKIDELNKLYQNQYNTMNGTIDMLLMASYLTTIYSYIIKYPELTFKILVIKQFFETFIQLTDLITLFRHYSTHQTKIVILGVCSILSNEFIFDKLTTFTNKIFAQLFTLLFRQKNEESKKMKQVLKKEFECNFVESGEEDNEENADDEDDYIPAALLEYKQAIKKLKNTKEDIFDQLGFFDMSKKFNIICSNTENSALSFDEYDIFSKVIYKLKSSQNLKFIEWENSLDETQKAFWNEILHTRRINLNVEDRATFNVPRRIVKVKRSGNSDQTPSG